MSKVITHPLMLIGGLFVFCIALLLGMNEFLMNRDATGHKMKPLNINQPQPSKGLRRVLDIVNEANWDQDPERVKELEEATERWILERNCKDCNDCDDYQPLTPIGDLK